MIQQISLSYKIVRHLNVCRSRNTQCLDYLTHPIGAEIEEEQSIASCKKSTTHKELASIYYTEQTEQNKHNLSYSESALPQLR